MKVSWRKRKYPGPVLEQFDPSDFSRQGPRIRYQNKFLERLDYAASTLLSFLDVRDSSVSSYEQIGAARKAIMESAVRNKLVSGFFCQEFKRQLSKLEKRPQRKYVIISYISADSSHCSAVSRRINGTQISIGASIVAYKPGRLQIAGNEHLFNKTPLTYSSVKVTAMGQSDYEALSKSDRDLHFLLGCWNHALTYGRVRFSFGRPGPVANLVLAPLRTLHEPSGSTLNRWLYDPDFAKYPLPFNRADTWKELLLAEQAIRAKLAKHKFRQFLENAFCAYHVACSCHLLDNTFLSLWALLETLTGTDQGDSVIRRTLYTIRQDKYEFCRWELEHLHYCRNCQVHRGETRSDVERLVYQLKMYVDVVLKCWLSQFGRLKEKEDVFRVLDAPHKSTRIAEHMRVLKHAFQNAKTAGR